MRLTPSKPSDDTGTINGTDLFFSNSVQKLCGYFDLYLSLKQNKVSQLSMPINIKDIVLEMKLFGSFTTEKQCYLFSNCNGVKIDTT